MRAIAEVLCTPPHIKMTPDYTLNTHYVNDIHYTYDVPDDHGTADLVCPYCTDSASLSEITL